MVDFNKIVDFFERKEKKQIATHTVKLKKVISLKEGLLILHAANMYRQSHALTIMEATQLARFTNWVFFICQKPDEEDQTNG